jgi:cholesterol oxidase
MYTVNRVPLASDWNQRRADGYDVIVIGSGYGGAVTAARLATAQWPNSKPSICILERGKEWLPGQFPDKLEGAVKESRNQSNPLGLYDNQFSPDIGVLMGSGLGGTSLVNANVAIRPDSELFDQPPWPQAVRTASQGGQLTQYYDRAHATLFAGPHPQAMNLNKVKALQKGSKNIAGAKFEIQDIVVNFTYEGHNNWGVQQRKCINCGDCTSGCNVGAKNTLDTNYLAIAKWGGTHIFTQVEVKHIREDEAGGYLINYLRRESAAGQAEEGTIKAKQIVVVAAGTLGTNGIMLRSRQVGLSLSDALGTRFSGNGDFFGVAYNSDERTNVLGWGAYPDSDRALRLQTVPGQLLNPGPAIVSRIRFNTDKPLKERFKSEDLSIPFMYVDAARTALAFMIGQDTDPNDFFDNIEEAGRRLRDIGALDPALQKGALNYSLAFLVNGHDDSGGRIELDPQTQETVVRWPDAGKQEIFKQMNQRLKAHTKVLGGSYIENPLWGFAPFRTLITAHPLGGCPMSDSHTTGVVSDQGQVFDANGNLYDGLYLADAAVIPTSIGVNPFMTISALAERRAEHLITKLGGMPAIINQIP